MCMIDEDSFKRRQSHYMDTWEPADRLIYDFCSRNKAHTDRAAAYSMVLLIDRTYATQLARTARCNAEHIYESITDAFVSQRDELSGIIAESRNLGTSFRDAHIEVVITQHARLRSVLHQSATALGDRDLDSFASKYLHFHAPTVPILDSRTEQRATDLCHLNAGPAEESRRLRGRPVVLRDGRYVCFVYRWWCLLNQARSQRLLPSTKWPQIPDTKFLDVYLWSNNGDSTPPPESGA